MLCPCFKQHIFSATYLAKLHCKGGGGIGGGFINIKDEFGLGCVWLGLINQAKDGVTLDWSKQKRLFITWNSPSIPRKSFFFLIVRNSGNIVKYISGLSFFPLFHEVESSENKPVL